MAQLFIVENNIAKPTTEILLISPYKEIWERDTTSTKEQAERDFTFIELMISKKKTNPYSGFDDDVRFEKLREQLYDPDWEPDELIQRGLAQYTEFQTEASVNYSLLVAGQIAINKLKNFLIEFDIDERNDRGVPIFKPRDITSALSDIDKIAQNFATLKEKVEQELYETSKTRNNREVNIFEQ